MGKKWRSLSGICRDRGSRIGDENRPRSSLTGCADEDPDGTEDNVDDEGDWIVVVAGCDEAVNTDLEDHINQPLQGIRGHEIVTDPLFLDCRFFAAETPAMPLPIAHRINISTRLSRNVILRSPQIRFCSPQIQY